MKNRRTRIVLITLVIVLSLLLCVLIGVCLFLENKQQENSEKFPASAPAIGNEIHNTEETELSEATIPVKENVEAFKPDDSDTNEPCGENETDRDYDTDEDFGNESSTSTSIAGTIENGNETETSNETVRDMETESEIEVGHDNELDRD